MIAIPSKSLNCQSENKAINVGVYDNPPKVFIDQNGKPAGIFIDIINSIAEKENLQINYVIGDWSNLLDKLEVGEISVMPDVAYSESRNQIFEFSMPVLSSWVQVYTTQSLPINSIDDLNNKRIGVLKGSVQENFLRELLSNKIDANYQIITLNDYTATINALKDSEIDVIVANRFFYFSELFDDDFVATGVILQLSDLHFAFPKDSSHTRLIKLFDNQLANLKNDPTSSYYSTLQKWFTKQNNTRVPMYIWWALFAISFVLIIVSGFAILLRYKVKEKTKSLVAKNDELIEAIQKAEESDMLKTAFLQNISHEVRTPLNGIIGFSKLLQNEDVTLNDIMDYTNIIIKSSERLMNTINDILFLSKIQTNNIVYVPSEFNLSDCFESLSYMYQNDIEEKNLLFEIEKPDDGLIIKSDPILIGVILDHLLNNAVKFTNNGKIICGYNVSGNKLEIFVKDTGIGINEDCLAKIFDSFYQSDSSISRGYEGTGLGLTIVHTTSKLIRSQIKVESEVGKGSKFYFELSI